MAVIDSLRGFPRKGGVERASRNEAIPVVLNGKKRFGRNKKETGIRGP